MRKIVNPPLRNPSGMCKCGCGGLAPLSTVTWSAKGMFSGYPLEYINGHNGRQPRQWLDDAAPFKIAGEYCRLIPLTQDLWSIIPHCRYADVRVSDWLAHWDPTIKAYYAVRWYRDRDGRKHKQSLHNFILNPAEGKVADHIDTLATLDNRRGNLRSATNAQSMAHRRCRSDNQCGLKGVWKRKDRKDMWCWQVRRGNKILRGSAKTKELAYVERCEAAKKLHGEFMHL